MAREAQRLRLTPTASEPEAPSNSLPAQTCQSCGEPFVSRLPRKFCPLCANRERVRKWKKNEKNRQAIRDRKRIDRDIPALLQALRESLPLKEPERVLRAIRRAAVFELTKAFREMCGDIGSRVYIVAVFKPKNRPRNYVEITITADVSEPNSARERIFPLLPAGPSDGLIAAWRLRRGRVTRLTVPVATMTREIECQDITGKKGKILARAGSTLPVVGFKCGKEMTTWELE